MDPGPISFTDKFNCKHVLFTFCKHLLPFDTSNPLCSANRWDWQPYCKLGQSTLVVLCAGSTLLLTPVVRPATSQLATPSEVTPFSYWSIKPWFLTEGKLAAVLITPSSWGSPTACPHTPSTRHQACFLAPLPGEKEDFCKGSLSSPISLLCYSFA